jgi:pSer/pThr/pTyr-binding forkhead associated (FHA) protein
MAPHRVRVEARWMPEESAEVERTREMDVSEEDAQAAVAAAPQGRPFLVLEGRRHVNLLQPLVSIGRALNNDIVIEDPRVSRNHAQLRRRYGRYVLYDLGSSGGTHINGYPVEECVLHSGDVISFAGVQVIYAEDPPTPIPLPGSEDTPALDSEELEPD